MATPPSTSIPTRSPRNRVVPPAPANTACHKHRTAPRLNQHRSANTAWPECDLMMETHDTCRPTHCNAACCAACCKCRWSRDRPQWRAVPFPFVATNMVSRDGGCSAPPHHPEPVHGVGNPFANPSYRPETNVMVAKLANLDVVSACEDPSRATTNCPVACGERFRLVWWSDWRGCLPVSAGNTLVHKKTLPPKSPPTNRSTKEPPTERPPPGKNKTKKRAPGSLSGLEWSLTGLEWS